MATRPSFVRGKGRGRGAKGTAPPPSTAAPPGGEPMNWAKKASPASPANQPRVGVSVVQPNAKQGKQGQSQSGLGHDLKTVGHLFSGDGFAYPEFGQGEARGNAVFGRRVFL